ncbi:MAG: chlorite dismutase family protein [Phycisphaeraceae bacterium]
MADDVAAAPSTSVPDLAEHGARGQRLDRRLFMQLLVFTGARDTAPLAEALASAGVRGALYEDVHDPRGVGLLAMSEEPAWFAGGWRQLLNQPPFDALTLKPELTMFGRSYALGYEPDLEETLIHRPTRTALNPDWPWVVWYPLRRTGAFARLSADEQREILKEHGSIGFAFGQADLAHDIRLACNGLDREDNDFVIGLTGRELHPLSAVVQAMRKTQQTALYLDRLGPFFVGRATWKSSL